MIIFLLLLIKKFQKINQKKFEIIVSLYKFYTYKNININVKRY